MTEPIVEARCVHKTYETGKVRVRALQGVDLVVARGELELVGVADRAAHRPDELSGGPT
jgi:predicted ABC-type transport system involved in lysophospholipase L1 biosynthesis ATPase subunit